MAEAPRFDYPENAGEQEKNTADFLDGYDAATEEYRVQKHDTAYTRVTQLGQQVYGFNYGQLGAIKTAISENEAFFKQIEEGDLIAFEEEGTNEYVVSINEDQKLTIIID